MIVRPSVPVVSVRSIQARSIRCRHCQGSVMDVNDETEGELEIACLLCARPLARILLEPTPLRAYLELLPTQPSIA